MIEVGIAIAAISVVRQLARKMKMMTDARMLPSIRWCWMESDGRFDEDRLIADDLRVHIFRQRGRDLLQPVFDIARRGDGVLAGLLRHDQRYCRNAVEPRRGHRLLVAVFGVADIADLHDIAVAVGDRDLVELRGIGHAARGADREILRAFLQAAAGQFQILRAQRVEDVGDRQVVGAQFIGIDQDVDLAPRAADDAHLADALRVFELLLDQFVGDHRQIAQRTRRRNRDLQHRRGVRIELLHDGNFRGCGQVVRDQVDLVLHFLRRDVAVLSRSNVMITSDWPSDEMDRTSSTWLMVLTESSIFFVISVSISSGDAPGSETMICTVGISIFGNRSTPRLK